MTEVLSSAYDDPTTSSTRRAALIAVALSFDTWKTIIRRVRLTDDEGVDVMVKAVEAAGRP